MNKISARVLIVDDSPDMRSILFRIIEKCHMVPIEAPNGETALTLIKAHPPDLVLLDIRMPGLDGHEVLSQIKAFDPDLPIIMITGFGTIQDAIQTVKSGAYDYILKPFNIEELVTVIQRAITDSSDTKKSKYRGDKEEPRLSLQEKMGQSPKIEALATEIARVAPTNFSVLILGETGTGKEVVAQAIHAQSHRANNRFVAIDCGAIPETLIESELFGHEKGAFTGADRLKHGKFETASGGTLFLDEISNLPMAMQSKILRALQEKLFYRVGGTMPIKSNVRIIAATNRKLIDEVGPVTFRTDLYYRLSEYAVTVPPIRERKEDIPFLVKRFIQSTNKELQKQVQGISEEALSMLMSYDWPGNARELRNMIRRAVLHTEDLIRPQHLSSFKPQAVVIPTHEISEKSDFSKLSLREILNQNTVAVERAVIAHALKRTGGNKAEVARLLHVDYKTIHVKIKKYGLIFHYEKLTKESFHEE